jgi:ribulose-5-phosphate 4-epimerase/fuculose-1-phosphate aldolase
MMASEPIYHLLNIRRIPPRPGDVTVGEDLAATMTHAGDVERIKHWGATVGSFVAQAMEVTHVYELDGVFEVAHAALSDARTKTKLNSEALEVFLEGVMHGGIVALDPGRSIIAEGATR